MFYNNGRKLVVVAVVVDDKIIATMPLVVKMVNMTVRKCHRDDCPPLQRSSLLQQNVTNSAPGNLAVPW